MYGAREDKGRKIAMKRLVRGEKGYILIAALLVLVVVGLISGPVLSYMVSGLRAGHVFETGAAELYAADAGWENAVLRIQRNIDLPTVCNDTQPLPQMNVNNKGVAVNITLVTNTSGRLYWITSTATTGNNSLTTIESYVKYTLGSDLNIFSGALASQTSITLAKGSTVNGDVYYCNATSISKTDVYGNWTYEGCGEFPPQSENVAFADAFKTLAMKGPTYPTGRSISNNGELVGSAYIIGNLDISAGNIVLNGTVYVTGTINAESDLVVTGSGSIIAGGLINFKKDLTYNVTGDSIIMSIYGGIDIDKAPGINALLYAPNGLINFKKEALVTGGVVGRTIDASKVGSFTFIPKTSWDFPGGLPGSYTIETYSVSRLS